MKRNLRVKTMILDTIKMQKGLFAAILFAVTGAIISALLPPLVLARIIDGIAAGDEVSASFLLLYFLLLALTGFLEAAREGLLTVFGQKMTHALRSSLMEKFGRLTSDNVNRQEPGALVSRFVGDVDTVENLFTSGIVSMFADACKIISILAVIWFRNRGLTFVLLVLLPFLFWFTRKICFQRRSRTGEPLDGPPVMCRRRFTISGRFTASRRKPIWKNSMTSTSGRAIRRWSGQIFMTPFIRRSF